MLLFIDLANTKYGMTHIAYKGLKSVNMSRQINYVFSFFANTVDELIVVIA